MRLLALFGTLVLSAAALGQDIGIYSEGLGTGWDDWSWSSTRNFAASSPVHSGSKSAAVTISAGWGALYLHHAPISTMGYSSVSFWIHGGSQGGQRFSLAALINGASGPTVNVGPLTANSWQQVTVPLGNLGAADKPNFDGIWLQENQGNAQPTFYLDDAKLVATPPPSSVSISVDATRVLQTVDDRVFGVNAAVWDAQFSSTATVDLMRAADVKIMRFPGGSMSNTYHWATGRSEGNNFDWVTNFDAFATAAKAIGSQAFISVNYGSGTPQEAADWVHYANVTKGYGFKYWEIGNENYGSWEMDRNTRPYDPVVYATRAKDYITQMLAVDPTIKIGVVVVTGEDSYANYGDRVVTNPRTGVQHSGWTPVLLTTLKQLGVTPHYVIYHKYAQAPGQESDSALLQSAGTWANDASDLRQQLNDYLGAAAANVELISTENNSVYTAPGKQTTSLVNGLFLADSYGQLLKTEFRANVWWDLRNAQDWANNSSSSLYGWRLYGDYGMVSPTNEPYPSYYGLKILKHFARGGDQTVEAISNYHLLSAYATRRRDGGMSLMVINKSPSLTLSGTFAISGFAPPVVSDLYQYGIPQDEAARTGTGSRDIALSSVNTGPTFTASFAPYSVSVIWMGPPSLPAPPLAPSNLTATATSSTQVNLAWTDNASEETAFEVERATNGGAWVPIATLGANTVSYSNTGLTAGAIYSYRVRATNRAGASRYSNIATAQTPGGKGKPPRGKG